MGRHAVQNRDLVTTPTLERMYPHQRSIVRMVVAGMRPHEIAEKTGYSQSQVSVIINSPCFLAEWNRLSNVADFDAAGVKQQLGMMADRALEVLDEDLHIEERGNKARQSAARDVLDRLGFGTKKPATTIKVEGDLVNKKEVKELSDEELLDEVMDLVEGDYEEV